MRLLYVIDSLAPGGAETSLAAMSPHLVAAGIDLHVLPLKDDLHLAASLRTAGATVHRPADGPSRRAFLRRTRAAISELRPDLVHTTLFEADVMGRLAAGLARLPASTSLVGERYGPARASEVPSRRRLGAARMADRVTSRFSRLFHAVSHTVADEAQSALSIPAERIVVIPRGRDPRLFPAATLENRLRVREDLGLDDSRVVLLGVGRQEPAKGQRLAIEAASTLGHEVPNLTLVLAGRTGQSTADLHSAAAASGVDVRFLGHRSDVADLMAAADLLVFPSMHEGSPGTLIEAMAVGIPIVTSDIGSSMEVLGGPAQDIAQTFESGNVGALTEAVQRMLGADPAARNERQARGRERFITEYSIDSISRRMVGFFDRAANAR